MTGLLLEPMPTDFLTPAPPVPADVETEQALLGTLLINNAVFFSLPTDLRAEHFYEPLHQRIFSAIEEIIQHGGVADPLTLKSRFDTDIALSDIGGGKYLGKLACAAITVISAVDCAKVLIDLAVRRKILTACAAAMQRATDTASGITSGEIAAGLLSEIESSAAISERYRISTERQVTERLAEKVQSQQSVANNSTGLNKLDKAMGGGMYAGKLYGIVGRKKFGKTMLAGTISTNLQRAGAKHLFIALEMGSDEIHQRNMARELSCYESDFRTGFTDSSRLNQLAEYAVTAKNHRLYLDAPGLTFAELRHILPMCIRRYNIDGFILDCWQLVGGKTRGQSTAEHLDAVAQWLAETTKRNAVWGLVTAQENQDENTRGGEGIRLACDQLYQMCKRDESSRDAWLNMMETRYTPWLHVGSEKNPALQLSEKCTHFEGI